MAQKHIHENFVGFYPEAVVCEGPGNWAVDATWIEHVSSDVSGLKDAIIVDPTLEGRSFAVGTRQMRKGIRNGQCSVGVKLHGIGVTTAAATQAAQTYIGRIWEHVMGGVYRGTRRAVVGGTASEVELDAVTGVIPGCTLWFQSADGKLHPRQVIAVDAGTKVVSLDVALFAAPAGGEAAMPAITGYWVSDVLVDAFGGPHTWQWFFRKEKSGQNLLWTADGTVASFTLDGLSKGGLPVMNLAIEACNFKHGSKDGLTNPSPTTFHGQGQLSMGKNVYCLIQKYGQTVPTKVSATNVTITPGIARERVESTTEVIDRTNGTATYSCTVADSTFGCTVSGYSQQWYEDLEEGEEFSIYFYQAGDSAVGSAGKAWGYHAARAQLMATPTRSDLNQNHAVNLMFKCMESELCTGGSNEDLERSRFTLSQG